MTSSRHTKIPIEHVKAELASFPFASEAALAQATVELCPKLSESSQTGMLWREAEQMLVSNFPGNSVDEAVSIRDHLWFSSPNLNQAIPLHQHLRRLAKDYLLPQGVIAIPQLPPCLFPKGDDRNHRSMARQTWWWLSVALPPDFLLAALHGSGHQPNQVETVSPLLSQQLADKGYAETHLHIGVGIDFRTLWTSSLLAIANSNFKSDSFFSPSGQMDNGLLLAPWLIRAAIIRYILAAYLQHRQEKTFLDFEEFIAIFVRATLLENCIAHDSYSLLLTVLSELQQGKIFNNNFVNLQQLYRGLTRVSSETVHSLEQLEQLDPIYSIFCDPQVPIDILFINKGLEYCEANAKEDELFTRLFWQVLRIQALLHRHTVQRPLTRGLQWFIRFYGRSSPCRKPLSSKLYLDSAAKLCGVAKGLKSLEVRTSPISDNSKLLNLIKELGKQAEQLREKLKSPFEFGLVLHFTKHRGEKKETGQPAAYNLNSNANPNPNRGINPQGFRFAHYYLEKQREAMSIRWLLETFPDSIRILRGLDVCTDELGIPNWVLAPLLTELREFSCVASNTLCSLTCLEIPPLRMTAHAGEDYIHLLTGLRNIDQAINLFKLTQGDRLGHCIALGIDPAGWAKSIGRVSVSKEERLLDLIWVWGKHGATEWWQEGHVSMEYELTELIYEIFGEISNESGKSLPSKFQLIHLMDDLSDGKQLEAIGFPIEGSKDPNLNNYRNWLLFHYLTNQSIFDKGQELVWIDPEPEARLLTNIQNELRRKIGTMGITVEVNPSSNQLIGDFSDLKTHPLWRLFPPIPLDNVPPVSICIGSDDPLVFASNLPQEYQRVHDALIIAGLSEQQVDNWLDKVRMNGLNSRFTLPIEPIFLNK